MPKKGDRTWTDDQLRDAVATSTSYFQVLQKLGLTPRGRNHVRIQEYIELLQLDTRHFACSPRPFADDQLRAIVPSCTSYLMVLERLGLEPTPTNVTAVQRRIRTLGLGTLHFLRKRVSGTGRAARWTDDDLRIAIAASQSFAETLRRLGLIPAGGNYDRMQRRVRELGLDTSHFTGQGWN